MGTRRTRGYLHGHMDIRRIYGYLGNTLDTYNVFVNNVRGHTYPDYLLRNVWGKKHTQITC